MDDEILSSLMLIKLKEEERTMTSQKALAQKDQPLQISGGNDERSSSSTFFERSKV